MMTHADITIDMARACSECGKSGVTESGLCLQCIAERIPETMKQQNAHMQPPLIKMSAAELAELKSKLSGLVGEYIQLEEEKKAADEDWNGRMGKLWEEIKLLRAKIEGAE